MIDIEIKFDVKAKNYTPHITQPNLSRLLMKRIKKAIRDNGSFETTDDTTKIGKIEVSMNCHVDTEGLSDEEKTYYRIPSQSKKRC